MDKLTKKEKILFAAAVLRQAKETHPEAVYDQFLKTASCTACGDLVASITLPSGIAACANCFLQRVAETIRSSPTELPSAAPPAPVATTPKTAAPPPVERKKAPSKRPPPAPAPLPTPAPAASAPIAPPPAATQAAKSHTNRRLLMLEDDDDDYMIASKKRKPNTGSEKPEPAKPEPEPSPKKPETAKTSPKKTTSKPAKHAPGRETPLPNPVSQTTLRDLLKESGLSQPPPETVSATSDQEIQDSMQAFKDVLDVLVRTVGELKAARTLPTITEDKRKALLQSYSAIEAKWRWIEQCSANVKSSELYQLLSESFKKYQDDYWTVLGGRQTTL